MQCAEQDDHPKGTHEGASQGSARAHHVVRDDLCGDVVGRILLTEELVAGVAASTADNSSAKGWMTDQHRGPRDHGPSVCPEWREARSVTRREGGGRFAVSVSLVKPRPPRRASTV